MTAPRRPLFLHIGTRKSGTSYLQASLRASVEPLKAQGLGTPFVDWRDHYHSLLVPVRDVDLGKAGVAQGVSALRPAVKRCSEMAEPRLLASFEDLAELGPEAIQALAAAFSDFDVQIIITARHWGTALPSEWQQCVKERLDVSFAEYVDAVRRGDGDDAARFLRRQDIASTIERWGAVFGMDRVHLIPLPAKVVDKGLLPRQFCGLVGVEPESLVEPENLINPSLGYDSAETLRRVNLSLGDRLPNFMNEYRVAVRSVLRRPLMRYKGVSPSIPPGLRDWCSDASREMVTRIGATGCDIVGDVDALVIADWAFAESGAEPSDADVARVAVSALADLTVEIMKLRRAGRSQPRKAATKLMAKVTATGAAGFRARMARLVRRVEKPAAELPAGDLSYVFVVAYGRSGSTLVQGLLNHLPGTLVRGENDFYLYPLFLASLQATRFRDKHENHGTRKQTSAFFGLDAIDQGSFAESTRALVTRHLLGSARPASVRTLGFKEVLWHRIPPGQTDEFFAFMDLAFPGAKYVLNSRSHDDVVGSGFWQKGSEEDARAAIERVEEIQAYLRSTRPERTFDTAYESLTGDDHDARDRVLQGLATFVSGSCTDDLLAELQETLKVGHGPNPFGASRGRRPGEHADVDEPASAG